MNGKNFALLYFYILDLPITGAIMVTSTITFHKRFDMMNGVVSERKRKR